MFKGFQDTSKSSQFSGFPSLNFQMNESAYGFSGAVLWLDAAFGLNTQTDLGAISEWKDRISGSKYTQSTAGSQPRLILSDVNFNGYPSVENLSSSKQLNAVSVPGIGSNFTFACVAKNNSISPGNSLIQGGSCAVLMGGTEQINNTGIGLYNNETGSVSYIKSTVEDIAPHVFVISNNLLIIDGAVVATTAFTMPGANFTNLFGSGSFGRTFLGRLAEFIGYNRSLSSTECVALSSALNAKYVIY